MIRNIIPAIVARFAYVEKWGRVYLIMMATMVVDIDHLLADHDGVVATLIRLDLILHGLLVFGLGPKGSYP